jgi:DNA-binding MarR family transcriptional regulator
MAVDKRPARPGGPIYYTYTDVGGGPLFRVVRSPGKRFHQERWDLARSRYVKGLGTDTIRVLYNLPGVFEQVIKGGTVWVCYAPDTEVLTERGWVMMPDLKDQRIAQYWSKDGAIDFVKPRAKQALDHDGEMVNIDADWSGLSVTPDHRVLCRWKKWPGGFTEPTVIPAKAVGQQRWLPVAGQAQGAGASPTKAQARVLAAWQADGVNCERGFRVGWNLKKDRKKSRLKRLLDAVNIKWREQVFESTPGWSYISVDRRETFFDNWLPGKRFNWKMLDWSIDARQALLNELGYWDGDRVGKEGIRYFTGERVNAEVISALASISSYGSIVRCDDRDRGDNHHDSWIINLVPRDWRTLGNKPTRESYTGKVYCVTVPSGFIVTRRNGKVTICGNCEGEKDADALIELGICATTNPGGAGKWRSEYAESLRGAGRIVICYDLDKEDPQTGKRQGEAHALQVEDSVKAVTNRIDFYHAAEGKDISDHLTAGLGVGDLVKERPGNQNAPEPKPEPREDHGGKATRVKEPAVYQLALERLREHARVNGLPKPRKTDKGWEACCPAHDDKDPSLGISVGTEQPMVVNCQANCEPEAIADALGIDFVDFFDEGTPEYDAALEKELQRQRVQQEARVIISSEAAPDITLPDSSPVDYFNKEAEAIAFSIVDWHVEGGNTLLVAQYKTGKLLRMDEPIPTPDGWNVMGRLKVGDTVFDERGKQCRVTYVSPTTMSKRSYRVVFSDGAWVIADAEHDWVTRTLRPDTTKVWTTEEIRNTLMTPDGAHRNHRIDVAAALDLPDRELPTDPYVFGLWLGDGDTKQECITMGVDKDFCWDEVERLGYQLGRDMDKRPDVRRHKVVGCSGHICGRKYIPIEYLRASYDQRLSLLQGIMDTDGTSDRIRRPSSLTTVKPELAHGYMELIRSLGLKPTIKTRKTKISGEIVGHGIAYVISFCAYSDTPVFRLPRKLALIHDRPASAQRSTLRTIVAIEPVESVPMRCIQVDSPSHLYLCGEAMIPTHNTSLAINLYRSLVNHEPFLGAYTVKEQQGRIAYFDYEMLEDQFRFWLKAGGDMNLNKMVTPYHLRGQVLPLWDKRTRAKVVEWLKRNDTSAIIIDTAARAWAGLVDNENSNTDMLRFTDSLDQLKYEAGITDLFLLTHMGRQAVFMEQGQERARGATRLEDWMDGGWYMTKDTDNVRYLRAQGRGIDIEPITLQYSAQSHKLTTQKIGKTEHQERNSDEMIVDILASLEHTPTTSQLSELLGGRKEDRSGKIHGAERRGLIERRQSGRSQMIKLTDVGRELQSRHRNLSSRKKMEADEVDVIKAQVASTAERMRYSGKRTPRRQGKPKEIDNGTEVTDTDS